MLRAFIIIVFLVNTCYGSAVYTEQIYSEKMNVAVLVNNQAAHNSLKANALILYLEQFSRNYFRDSLYFKVVVNPDYKPLGAFGTITKQKYYLGYGKSYFLSQYDPQEYKQVSCVILHLYSDVISYKDVLKMLYYAATNIDDIQKEQTHRYLRNGEHNSDSFVKVELQKNDFTNSSLTGSYDYIHSVTHSTIESIISSRQGPDFSEILGRRFYRYWLNSNDTTKVVDYYIQNDSFYLYHKEPDKSYSLPLNPESFRRYFATYYDDKSFLSFNHIKYIASDKRGSCIVFINPFDFYYYDAVKKTIYGMYRMPELEPLKSLGDEWGVVTSITRSSADEIIIHAGTYYGNVSFMLDLVESKVLVDSCGSKEYIRRVTQ